MQSPNIIGSIGIPISSEHFYQLFPASTYNCYSGQSSSDIHHPIQPCSSTSYFRYFLVSTICNSPGRDSNFHQNHLLLFLSIMDHNTKAIAGSNKLCCNQPTYYTDISVNLNTEQIVHNSNPCHSCFKLVAQLIYLIEINPCLGLFTVLIGQQICDKCICLR